MPILDIQRQHAQVGKIRLGNSVPTGKTGAGGREVRRPVKLDAFRITTPSEALARQVAELYGGTPKLWTPQGGGAQQWEVFTAARSLPVVVPLGAMSQWYEMWAGSACTRRCDGRQEVMTQKPCVCPPHAERKPGRHCQPVTRVNLMIGPVHSAGVWLLETHGYYAAMKIPPVVELLDRLGGYQPARLELTECKRSKAKPGGGTETIRWIEPLLHVEHLPAAELTGAAPRAAIAAGPAAAELVDDDQADAEPVDQLGAEPEPAGPPPAADVDQESRATAADQDEAWIVARAKMLGTPADLRSLYRKAVADGKMTKRAADFITARAARLEAMPTLDAEPVDQAAEPAPAGPTDVVDAELVDETPARPPTTGEQLEAAWMTCVAAAGRVGWDNTRLMREFRDAYGVPVSEGSAEQFAAFCKRIQ